jgi:hypothetical protein
MTSKQLHFFYDYLPVVLLNEGISGNEAFCSLCRSLSLNPSQESAEIQMVRRIVWSLWGG